MKLLLLTAILCISFLGCSTDQDPLKGQPDSIRDGVPKGKEKPKVPPIPVNAILVELDPVIAEFTEGQENKLKISVRILDPETAKKVIHFEC